MGTNGLSVWLKCVALVGVLSASTGSAVFAQAPREAQRGETRRLRADDVAQVSVQRSDSVLNGALIGAGVAVGSGLVLCRLTEPWENCRDDIGPMLKIGALGAGIGIGIDALFRKRMTIYPTRTGATRLHVSPIVSRQARGFQVAFSF